MTRTYFVLFFVLIFLGVFFIGSLAATIAANMYQSREAGTFAGLVVKAIFAIAVYIMGLFIYWLKSHFLPKFHPSFLKRIWL